MTENPFAAPEPGPTPPPAPGYAPPPGYGPPPTPAPPPGYPVAPAYGAPTYGDPGGYGRPDESLYGEVAGFSVASPARRLAGFALTVGLIVVTLVVGYVVWALVLWSQGTTPAKRLLGMKMVSTRTGQTLGWGEMCVRNFVLGGVVLLFANTFTAGLAAVADGLFLFFGTRQRLIDKIGGYQVVMA